jgi:insertion element IS1 protein InsB
MNWVKELGEELPEDKSGELNLPSWMNYKPIFGCKTNKIWIWTAINYLGSGIIAMEIGYLSGQTFDKL